MNKEDKLELKVLALTQRISELVSQYEDKVADLRVELTAVTNEKNSLNDEALNLRGQLDRMAEDAQSQDKENPEEE